jgi:hypothetical protein
LTGETESTVGGVGAGTVLKVQTKLLANALPAGSFAAVVIVAVYSVLVASRAVGAKVAMLPLQLTVPGTEVTPGPVTVKVVAGELRVAQFIASLKVTLRTWFKGTPVAPFRGEEAVTVGRTMTGSGAVVNDHTYLAASALAGLA